MFAISIAQFFPEVGFPIACIHGNACLVLRSCRLGIGKCSIYHAPCPGPLYIESAASVGSTI
jgi:hypothetical protein